MRILCTCGKTLRVTDALVGKTVRCPVCKAKIKVEMETEEIETVEQFFPPAPRRKDPPKAAEPSPPRGRARGEEEG